MSGFASLFVGGRQRLLLSIVTWTTLFIAFFGAGWAVVLWQLSSEARRDRGAELTRAAAGHAKVASALQKLNHETTARDCSDELRAAMERIAFLPDGLNKFLYAPGGIVRCSTSRKAFEQPVDLGAPDIAGSKPGTLKFWVNRNLSYLTRVAPIGTVASLNDFAVVVPPYGQFDQPPSWLRKELVLVDDNGRSWSMVGKDGLYQSLAGNADSSSLSKWAGLAAVSCNESSPHCVATQVLVGAWAREWIAIPFLLAGLAALLAKMGTSFITGRMNRYWSFEARFMRHLDNVVAVYQPIVDLHTRRVSGCEVLARWRDLDGTIVPPDVFLGIVERTKRTAEFTQLIVDRAHRELSSAIPHSRHLDVNFNIFGCDLTSETLVPMLSKFTADSARFTPAIEIVEHHDLEFDSAQAMIHDLRQVGIKVYIDDFGIGYSSIERAARLEADGVKLDRAFAMAPAHSMMERLLFLALDMLRVSGRKVVVEGVETMDRLESIAASTNVDYVQGYVISAPVPIADFAAFLKKDRWGGAPEPNAAPAAAGVMRFRNPPAAVGG